VTTSYGDQSREERAAALLEQGRYRELRRLVDDGAVAGPEHLDAVLWHVRGEVQRGYVRAAALRLNGLPDRILDASDTGTLLRLWRRFLALYGMGDGQPGESPDQFAEWCGDQERAPGCGAVVSAVAADLRGRAVAMGFVLTGRGPRHRGEVVPQLARAAGSYRRAGLGRESVAALRRAAAFGMDGLAADRLRSRELLLQAQAEAEHDRLALAATAARLDLAELNFRELLERRDDHTWPGVTAAFDVIAGRYRDDGHAYGDALVSWRMTRWLLAYGQGVGLPPARLAAQQFAAADVPAAEQPVWAALNAWCMAHGDPQGSRQARAQEARLAAATGWTLAAEVRALDEANQSFRSADVARVRALLTRRPRASPSVAAGYRLTAVTSTLSVGLRQEAREMAEELIADLTESGADLVLGEVLLVLASLLTGHDDDRAAALLGHAIELAHASEQWVDEAKYRAQLAWATAHRRRARGQLPFFDDQVRAGFDQAAALLESERSLSARAELAMLYELRGQAAFISSDWDASYVALSRAETVARTMGLMPHLAAICCHQGLVLIELGRRLDLRAYDRAADRLDESRRLYQQAALPSFYWQVTFHRALCDIESGRRLPPGEADVRFQRAGLLMEEASRVIDRIRRSSEGGGADRQQRTWTAFAVSKQEFYTQGFQLAWHDRGDPADAWLWLERMKGRALLDALADRRAAPQADARPARLDAVRLSEPPGWTELRQLLAAEEKAAAGRRVVVAGYACTPRQTLLFGARADWPAPQMTAIPIDHGELERFTARTFRARGGVRALHDQADGALAAWHGFSALLDPLSAWTAPGDVIYLVPYGVLHDLPLHTLMLEGRPLIERNPVCYLPAAAVLRHALPGAAAACSPTGDGTSPTPAVFGDSRKDLKHAREEAAAVAALLGVRPVIGGNVTRSRVLRALETASIVHIACHGRLAAADGFASSIDLAGHDTLQAADLLGRPCHARLVVLSGCETGVGERRPGDEVMGFIRALLLSGAQSILASQWRVPDASTRDLLLRFHQNVARDPAVPLAEALRRAVLDLRAQPGYEHIYHWGGFALVGSWR
jgi:CHAT domain